MPKSDKKARKDKQGGAADAVDSIRSAIERTLEGAGLNQKRQKELADEVSAAAGRVRKTIDDLKVVDEVRDLRAQLDALTSRIASLESGARTRVTGAARRGAKRSAKRSTAAGSAKPAAKRAAAKSSAKRAAAKRSTAKRSTAKRSTAKRSTAKRSTAKRSTAKRSTAKRSTASRAKAAKSAGGSSSS
jgi:hypothetical protein